MPELERYWSPDPVYAFKFYSYSIPGQRMFCFIGETDVKPGKLEEYTCHYKNHEPTDIRPLYRCRLHGEEGQIVRLCEGDFGSHVHSRYHEHCPEDKEVVFATETCGFYSFKFGLDSYKTFWKLDKKALDKHHYPVLLLVSLHGTIVEHEFGYKSTHMRVEETVNLDYDIQDIIDIVAESYINSWKEKYYG